MNIRRRFTPALGALLGTIAALLFSAVGARAADRPGYLSEKFHQTYPLGAGGYISLRNINGPVHITGWDKNEVQVDAVKTARSEDRLKEAEIRVEASAASIYIETKYPDHEMTFRDDEEDNPASVEYTLMVPRGAKLDEIKLINGSLDIAGVSSVIRAECINGRMVVHDAKGELELRTINGRLEAFVAQVPQSVNLRSVNGSVSVTVPANANAEVTAETVHGFIHNDFGLEADRGEYVGNSFAAKLGDGSARIRLSNVNGGIDVHREAGPNATAVTPLPSKYENSRRRHARY